MAISVPSECRKFRAAIVPMFVFFVVADGLCLFGFVLGRERLHFAPAAVLVAGASLLVFSLIASCALSLSWPAGFSGNGVYGHSFWGVRRFVRWQEIEAARTFRLLNLQWLRIYRNGDGEVTWLALFQSDKNEFQQEIRRLAPPGNPVLEHFG
jgi:hypothetical protein